MGDSCSSPPADVATRLCFASRSFCAWSGSHSPVAVQLFRRCMMASDGNEEVMERLRDLVLVEEKVVTFNYLSETFSISAKQAQESMMAFKEQMEKDGRKDEIVVTFILTGYGKDDGKDEEADVRVLKVMQVEESELQSCREMFFGDKTGVTIKSIREKNATSHAELEKNVRDLNLEQDVDDKADVKVEPDREKEKEKERTSPAEPEKKVTPALSEDDEMDFKPSVVTKSTPEKKKNPASRNKPETTVVRDILSDDENSDEEVVKPKKRRRVMRMADSDSDEEPVKKTMKDHSETSGSDQEEEEESDVVIVKKAKKSTSNKQTGESKKAKAAMARLQKEEEKERKQNGKVVAKEEVKDEMVDVEEEFEDGDGFINTRVTKKMQPISAAVLKARKEAENASQNSLSSQSQKSQKGKAAANGKANAKSKASSTSSKGRAAAPPQKKITDFFTKS